MTQKSGEPRRTRRLTPSPSVDLNSSVDLVDTLTTTPVQVIGGPSAHSVGEKPNPQRLGPREVNTDLDKFFQVPRLVKAVASAETFGTFTVFPTWVQIPVINQMLSTYRMFRGDLVLTISVTGNSSVIGLWRIFAVPKQNGDDYNNTVSGTTLVLTGDPRNNGIASSNYPHLDVDLSQTGSYTFKVPYVGRNAYEPITSYIDYTIRYNSLAALENISGTTPDPIKIHIYAHYENVDLYGIRPSALRSMMAGLEIQNQGLDSEVVKRTTMSAALSYAAGVANLIPMPVMSPLSKMLTAGADLAQYMGWSRTLEPPTTSVVVREVNPMALMSGAPNMSYPLGSNPGVVHDVSGAMIPFNSPGETGILSMCRRWSNITIADLPHTIVAAPGVSFYVSTNPQTRTLTNLGFVSSAFTYWCGSLEFRFKFISSPFLRTRVGIMIIPPYVADPGAFIDDGTFKTYVVEVVGTTVQDVIVPYYHETNVRPIQLVDRETTPLSETRVGVYIITGPMGPNSDPPPPRVQVWIRAGEDFEMGLPTLDKVNRLKLVNQGLDGVVEYVNQGAGDFDGSQTTSAVHATEAAISGTGRMGYTFGERFDDIHSLCRRVCYVARITGTNGAANSATVVSWPVGGVSPVDANAPYPNLNVHYMSWSYATYFRTAFMGWTGGNVWSVAGDGSMVGPKLVTSGVANPGLTTAALGSSSLYFGGSGSQWFPENRMAEVTVPMRSTYQYLQGLGAPAVGSTQCLLTGSISPTPDPFTVALFHAGADDFHMTGYLCPPIFYVRT